jgi:plasmid stabilization system protein ParE
MPANEPWHSLDKRALRRLDQIGSHIARHDAAAAERVVLRIHHAGEALRSRPFIGRPGRVPSSREMVLTDIPYVIAYRLTDKDVEILSVLHMSQRWPESF